MKKVLIKPLTLLFILSFTLISCKQKSSLEPVIYLLGEAHSVKACRDRELKDWDYLYKEKNVRNLFIETSFCDCQILNIWMKEEEDSLLDMIFEYRKGTPGCSKASYDFYMTIKRDYPETVFYGNDICHQYKTTGQWYLDYLESNNLKDSVYYQKSIKAIEQGRLYYQQENEVYRENCMVENFIAEYSSLPEGTVIMGIYGAAHIGLKSMNYSGECPSMGNQLNKIYIGQIKSDNIAFLKDELEPLEKTTVKIKGKEYTAYYYGEEDLTGFKDFKNRKFYRFENPDKSLMKAKKRDYLPYSQYPMPVHSGDVLYIIYQYTNGSVGECCYTALDDDLIDDEPVTWCVYRKLN